MFTQTIQNTTFAGVALRTLSQPLNADSGDLYGIEVNAQQRFTFLPEPLDGLGVSANATYVNSEVEVPGREDEDLPFFRQSKWLLNGTLFFEKGPFAARVAVAYRTGYIENIGSPTQGTAADIYEAGRTGVDARIGYQLLEGVEVFGSVSNIADAPLAYYQTTKRQTYSREIYGFNADFGVSAKF